MELVRGLNSVSKALRGCVLTVGNYDGVHLGHQHMIGVRQAAGGRVGPRPRCSCSSRAPRNSSIRTPRRRASPAGARNSPALAALEVDRLVTLRFDERMRAMSPEDFVDRLIVQGLGARHVVVGDDFRYGSRACGTIESLRAAGRARGFGVEQVEPFVVDGVRVSSTAVRERLQAADFARGGTAARTALSHDGSAWRTASSSAGRSGFRPPICISCAASRRCGAFRRCGCTASTRSRWTAFASLGTRPTVNGVEPLLEVHVFDFAGDLYGRLIEVEFIAKLRDEVKFDSLDSMVVQMKVDAAQAREILSKVS